MKQDPYKRLRRLEKCRIRYSCYLWKCGYYSEFVQYMGKRINRLLLTFAWAWILVLVIAGILVDHKSLADGTSDRFLLQMMVSEVNMQMDAYMQAYKDISKLAGAVEKTSDQRGDRAFVYAFLVTKYAREYGFKPEEIAGLVMTESEFKTTARSKCDAHGLMQIHRPTWGDGDWYNPEVNIESGVRILYMYRNSHPRTYLKRYGGWADWEGDRYVHTVRKNQKIFLKFTGG